MRIKKLTVIDKIAFVWVVIILGFGFQCALLLTTKLPFYLTPLIPILCAKMWYESVEQFRVNNSRGV